MEDDPFTEGGTAQGAYSPYNIITPPTLTVTSHHNPCAQHRLVVAAPAAPLALVAPAAPPDALQQELDAALAEEQIASPRWHLQSPSNSRKM